MIPWCMRAANSAGATATGEIATPPKHTDTDTKLGKTIKAKKDVQCVKAGPVPTQDKLPSGTLKGKPFGQLHQYHIRSVWSVDQNRKKTQDPDVQMLCCTE